MKLAAGLYLNEVNGQTFEIVDCSDSWCYVRTPDFFYNIEVHQDEILSEMQTLILASKITFIGEV